ncbi:hypothetical protein GCM10009613_60170 [Pseudonocardia kongjuensis]|uniref:ATP-grasp target RiPP n=1 Tax=Pseudonocardia kongjuensis TaxID=102227 RepID=A0ABN1YEJ0_9PSEU
MSVLGEMFPRKRIHEDSDAAQGGEQWRLGPIDLEKGVVTMQPAPAPETGDDEQSGNPDDSGQSAG